MLHLSRKSRHYSIAIYALDGLLIYTAAVDMYFDKYKGNGPGYYSKPILASPQSCSQEEIEAALRQCIQALQDHRDSIFRENSENDAAQMEKKLFPNFKLVGITASRAQIIKNATELLVRRKEEGFTICKSKAKGRYMMVQKEASLPAQAPLSEVARCVSEFLADP